MASVKVEDNLAFVAAALSAITEKHIVPRKEYEKVKEKIRRGENTGYVCKGEVNVVEEIKQTYAKTAVLVASKYHPELVHQGKFKDLAEITTLGRTDILSERGTAKISSSEDVLELLEQSTHTDNVTPTMLYDDFSISSETSTFDEINKGKETSRNTNPPLNQTQESQKISTSSEDHSPSEQTVFLRDGATSGNKSYGKNSEPGRIPSESSDEDTFKIYSRKEQRTKRTKFKFPNHQSGNDSNHSSNEDVFLLTSDKERLIKKEKKDCNSDKEQARGEASSEENVEVYSDEEPLIGGSRKKWNPILSEMRFGRNRSLQDLFPTQQSDQDSLNSTQDFFQDVQDVEPLLTESRDKYDKSKIEEPVLPTIGSEIPRNANTIDLLVVQPSGKTIVVSVTNGNCTVEHLKEQLQQKTDIRKEEQVLHFGGNLLQNTYTLQAYNITRNSTIHLSIKIRGGKKDNNLYFIDQTYLASDWDYSFKRMKNDGTEFKRGGYTYHRPYGWKRHAIKVLGKYEDDVWLGAGGIKRTEQSRGEWAVSYHGTSQPSNINSIYRDGYIVGLRRKFGEGVYSAPRIEDAVDFAAIFKYGRKKYHVVLQNRVDPRNKNTEYEGKYWVCPDPTSIRPYGICIQRYHKPKVPKKPNKKTIIQ